MDHIAQKAIMIMVQSHSETWTEAQLALVLGQDVHHLRESFRNEWGITAMEWLWMFRTILASEVVAQYPEIALERLAHGLGFQDCRQLEACFFNLLGRDVNRLKSQYQELSGHLEGPNGEREPHWPLAADSVPCQRALASLQQGLAVMRQEAVRLIS